MLTTAFRPRFLASLLALTLAATLPASAQEAAAPAPAATLTLEECIARALKKNFDLQLQAFDTANAKESLTVSKAGYDPTFSVTASKSVNQNDTPATTLTGSRSESADTRVGVAQKIASGATVNLSGSLARSETNNTYSTLNPAYNSDVSLSIKQPLLNGAGPTVNNAAIRRAELGVTRADLTYQSALLQVVANTENAYYNLMFAHEQLKVRLHSLELAETLLNENKDKKNTGVATDLDVLQADVGVANARRNVLDSQRAVRDRQDALLNLIGQFEFDTTIGDLTLAPIGNDAVSFDTSYSQARAHQPDYISTQASIRQLELDAATAKNASLPSLDLGGAVGYNALDRSASRALDRLPDGDGYNWQIDLSLSVPWGRRAEKARYRIAQNNLQREQARLRQVEQDLMVQVRAAVRAVDTSRESVDISTQATALSEKQYELEKARYDAGLSTSRFVLEAQDSLEQARMSELQTRVNYRAALAELHRLEGSSFARYSIPVAPVAAN